MTGDPLPRGQVLGEETQNIFPGIYLGVAMGNWFSTVVHHTSCKYSVAWCIIID